jgi:hypothetical protein
MNLLSDIITYIRRIIKSPSDAVISDNLIIDYINRFWITDVDARIQLFDLKTKYSFQTTPGVDQYNMPLYSSQLLPGGSNIGMFPVYQGFVGSAWVNGYPVNFQTQKELFFNNLWNVVQNLQIVGVGNGTAGPYALQVPILGPPAPPNPPFNGLLRGHIDITGIIATGINNDPVTGLTFNTAIPTTSVDSKVYITSIDGNGNNVVVQDSGQFLEPNVNCGILMQPGPAPFGNLPLPGAYGITNNVVNYFTGQIYVTFPVAIPAGNNINVQCYYFQNGLPRTLLFYNNTITLRPPPATQYLVELDAYLTPAAFLNTASAIPFGYMAEYIARGAARKILSDTGDQEQFMFYEPLFKEQEMLVWKRSQRQWTSTRTQTIYSKGMPGGNQGQWGNNMGTF